MTLAITHPTIPQPSTLVDLLLWRAQSQSNQQAFSFLLDGEADSTAMTYGELDQQARSIAARLQQMEVTGERALLIFPPGLQYIAAFFGCLYAGVVAVPAYPPHPARLDRTLPRLRAIVRDAQPLVALTTAAIASLGESVFTHDDDFSTIRWLATDTFSDQPAMSWQPPAVSAQSLAFLQYTSGSTSTPKGVMLTHGNLIHNLSLIYQAFGHSPRSRGVIWLPPYHDMGLIGGILQPLYGGFPVTLMSPVDFLQRPFRWLQAISRTGGTTSGGPNFAYELCVQKVTPEQLETLDLSSWDLAFNGAEPIRHDTMARFATMFAPCGFRREAWYPCYGLAEATLIVSGGSKGNRPRIQAFSRAGLGAGRVGETPSEHADIQTLVGCGQALAEQQIAIADPQTAARCQPDQIGEIWVSGPSIAHGYWSRPVETVRDFQAYLADSDEGPFLRTGDLGFVHAGELFVTGRLKDLIIIRGRNYYPQDIECTVEQSHPALRSGSGAAFSLEIDGEEQIVIVQEIDRQYRSAETQSVADAIRKAVSEQHELRVHAIAIIRHGSIPKTSSGKIQRHACRKGFLDNTLRVVGLSILDYSQPEPVEAARVDRQTLLALAPEDRLASLEHTLQRHVAQVVRMSPVDVDIRQPLTTLGLDSLMALALQHSIEEQFGVLLPMTGVLAGPSIAQLAREILDLIASAASSRIALTAASTPTDTYPLSYGQRAIWFLQQLAPENTAYNIASAVRVQAQLDLAALRRATQAVVDRHPSLRTTFAYVEQQPVQLIDPHMVAQLVVEDATIWSEEALYAYMREITQQPFDLEHGPLFRLDVFNLAADHQILLLTIHHAISDFWSLAVLVEELSTIYAAECQATPPALAPLEVSYIDYVHWQIEMLEGAEGARLWNYWQQQLAGSLLTLNLPIAGSRPPIQTYTGAAHVFTLASGLTQGLKQLGEAYSTTLYTTLLSAFHVLLFRYTGQEDILIGSPTTGRSRAMFSRVLGYFVNLLVLRAQLSSRLTFADVLQQVRRTVLAAFDHQDFPFALLAERLQPDRDPSRSPLIQIMFSLQQSPQLGEANLSPFAIGETQASLMIHGLPLEAVALEQQTVQFDLTLVITPAEDRLVASLQYNTDLFSAARIERMAEHFQTLLAGIVATPEQPIARLPLLATDERSLLLEQWNRTATPYAQDVCIHHLFERQVAQTPDAIALVFEDVALDYTTLNRQANQLGHYLQARGIGPDSRVGICMERSPEMMVGLLGILKAGAAYIPLDPTYPQERLAFVVNDAQVTLLLTQQRLRERLPATMTDILCVDTDSSTIRQESQEQVPSFVSACHLAYVIYTSGSTGQPKGVMLTHRNVSNFFVGMDQRIGCDATDTLLAVTSISFDISVLELLWTLTRGAKVVLLDEQVAYTAALEEHAAPVRRPMQFSLFYFASNDRDAGEDKYRLLLEGAKFADQHDFAAVWTPERHFHAFGGLYPNPVVTSAALATITRQIQIRAGSVVLPLHNPLRVAEEWAVVDNLSQGRVGIAFASGWHSDDFAFFPANYPSRKMILVQGIATVQQLWRGEAITVTGGAANEIAVRIYPRPIQPRLPIWLTAAGSPDTFVKAGELGANVLTHLLGQSVKELAQKIALYRESLGQHGHDPAAGQVTLMLHTFIGEDKDAVREKVRVPFTEYLRTSVDLIRNLITSMNMPLDLTAMSKQDMDDLLAFAFDRYFETSALFGTPETCLAMIERLKAIGVDEIACLIDFGVDGESVLAGLHAINELRERDVAAVARVQQAARTHYSLAQQALRHKATLMQCTPSLMQMLSLSPTTISALNSLRTLMLGGEALPPTLAAHLLAALPAKLVNMYGPTETTIWSATHDVQSTAGSIPIGRPITNTEIYILNQQLEPVPAGVPGELYIGGAGIARGYLNRPQLTAERFVPDPFSHNPGRRLYKTGDLARYQQDGTIEFLGRIDQQVKVRGFRIELEEIEVVLCQHPAIREAVVVVREDVTATDGHADRKLVAYVVETPRRRVPSGHGTRNHERPASADLRLPTVSGVAQPPSGPDGELAQGARSEDLIADLRLFLSQRLPSHMIPSAFMVLTHLPLTPNGKINRNQLPAPNRAALAAEGEPVAPRTPLEETVAGMWVQILKLERVGIYDNFFALGGHSLLVIQLLSQVRAKLQVDLPVHSFFEAPTISGVTKNIEMILWARQSRLESPITPLSDREEGRL